MASERYNAPVREKHWQQVWEERGTFGAQDKSKKPKRYQLEMFPYPRGGCTWGHAQLHAGRRDGPRRRARQGLQRGCIRWWYAFGLAGEERRHGAQDLHPAEMDLREHRPMAPVPSRRRWRSIDWSRESPTCDPSYYADQQRLFLDFLKKKINGQPLAYRKIRQGQLGSGENTVLANEQVIDGRGWRSAPPSSSDLTQWFFRIIGLRRGCCGRRWRLRRQRGRILAT